METIKSVLERTTDEAITGIFQQYGMQLDRSEESQNCYDTVAVIGFSGDFIGAVGFATEKSFVKAAYGETNTELSDSWVGEIANQLLGRLKNALLAYGIEIQIALPMVLYGIKIQIRSVDGEPYQSTHKSTHKGEPGCTCVWVSSNWDIHQEVHLQDEEHHATLEGKTMLF